MATFYWYWWSGSWSDYANHWSLNSWNSPASPASAEPTSSDNVIFDVNSASWDYSVNVTSWSYCNNFTASVPSSWNLNLYSSGLTSLNISWDVTFYNWMLFWSTLSFNFNKTWNATLITNWANVLVSIINISATTVLVLWDDLNCSNIYWASWSWLNANWKNLIMSLYSVTSFNFPIISWSFNNLSITGIATKSAYFSLSSDIIVNWTFTVNSNSSTNRIFIRSNTKWIQRTITAATVSVTSTDFQDIIWAWAWSWDLSSITGWSWDCWWNSWITFTTPVTTTCTAWTTWSSATWSVRVPLPQDTANFSWSSRTITQNMTRIWSVDFTWSSWLTWTTSTTCSFFWSINLTNLWTLTSSSNTYTYEWRWTSYLTTAWKNWAKMFTINCVNWVLNLVDNCRINLTSTVLTSISWSISWEWYFTLISNSSSSVNISWWWNYCWKLWNSTSWTWVLTISGWPIFWEIKSSAWRTIRFQSWTDTRIWTFNVSWTSGNRTIIGTVSWTPATLTKLWWWVISNDKISISKITWSPANTWYMWTSSVDGWENTNINFTNPPTDTSKFFMFL